MRATEAAQALKQRTVHHHAQPGTARVLHEASRRQVSGVPAAGAMSNRDKHDKKPTRYRVSKKTLVGRGCGSWGQRVSDTDM